MSIPHVISAISHKSIQSSYKLIYETRIAALGKTGLEGCGLGKAEIENIKQKLAIEKLTEQCKINLRLTSKNELEFDTHDAFILEITKKKPSWSYRKVAEVATGLGCPSTEGRVRYLWKKLDLEPRKNRYQWTKYNCELFDMEIQDLEFKKVEKYLNKSELPKVPVVKEAGDLLVHKLFHLGVRNQLGRIYLHVWLDMSGGRDKGFILVTESKSPEECFEYFRGIIVPDYKINNLSVKSVMTDNSKELNGVRNYYSRGLVHLGIKQIVDFSQKSEQFNALTTYFKKLMNIFEEAEVFDVETRDANELNFYMTAILWKAGFSKLSDESVQLKAIGKWLSKAV